MNNSEIEDEPLPVKQARDMYTACMDTDAMTALGLQPIYEFLAQFKLPAIPSYFRNETSQFNLIQSLGAIKRGYGKDVFLGVDLFADPRNRSQYRIAIGTPEKTSGLPM